jgi:nucleoid DNA-binding protein
VTQKELLKNLLKLGLTKRQAHLALDSFFGAITTALKEGRKVSIVGLGSWEWRKRPARLARNPKTGKRFSIVSREVLFFRPASRLREKLKG